MSKIITYRIPLPSYGYSLFGGKLDPRAEKGKEYSYRELVSDTSGRPLSNVRFSENGEVVHRKEIRYAGERLTLEREEFVDVGSVVTREHEYQGNTETINVRFAGELDERIIREMRDDGSLSSERSTGSDGELRSATEWNEAGKIIYSELPGIVQRYTYDGEGNLVELDIDSGDTQTVEKTRFIHGRIEEVDIIESGEPIGKRIYEREEEKLRITETIGGRVTMVRVEEYDRTGRPVLAEESAERDAGDILKTSTRYLYYNNGKPKMIQSTRQDSRLARAGRNSITIGVIEYVYDEKLRLSETLLSNFHDEELEDDSYYRFEYID